MPPLRDAEVALRLATNVSRQQYVCRTCRAQAIRQFHASNHRPFINRIRESLFGSKESKEAEKKREEKVQAKVQEQARRDATNAGLETRRGRGDKEYEVAAIVDTSINPEYIMSANWDGLRRIGSDKWIKERADPGVKYAGFMPEKRLTLNDNGWKRLLHHVTVEALALKEAGRNVNDICLPRSGRQRHWRDTNRTTIVSDETSGNVSLRFESPDAQQRVISAILSEEPEVAVTEEQGSVQLQPDKENLEEEGPTLKALQREVRGATDPEESKPSSEGSPWTTMRLSDPMIKLAILKRIMQLTGHRIPDPTISNANTLSDLYNALKTKEPPKKLAKTPEMKALNKKLSNVVVHSARRTPIHKEKEIGRWKIIEDELVARDLPVTGSRFQDAKPRVGDRQRIR